MKKIAFLLTFSILFMFSCSIDGIETNEQLQTNESEIDILYKNDFNTKKQSGFDEWGFNFTAHQFNSYLINALLADPAFDWAPWYRIEGLVYNGEGEEFWNNLIAEYPDFVYMMPSGLLDCKFEMKWNEAALSSEGIYPPTWNDTGAWFLFKYKMNTKNEKWTQVRKFVCISEGHQLVDGIWYNSEGEEIGMLSYYWADTLIIKQVVNTGDNPWVPSAMPPDYRCPNWVGFGNI